MSVTDIRKKLRDKTVGGKSKLRSIVKEFDGEKFEIKQPTVATRGRIMKECKVPLTDDEDEMASKIDYSEMQVWAVIYCTFVPGTNERVFTEADADLLRNQPAGSFVDEFAAEAMDLMNVAPEEAAKNSEKTEDKSESS